MAIDFALCSEAGISVGRPEFVRNYSIFAPHLDTSCWHKWLPLFNLSTIIELTHICTHFCLSSHRIHDGVVDCIAHPLDESMIVHPLVHHNDRCLHCITHTLQAICLLTDMIDSAVSLCVQDENTYFLEANVAIKMLKCASNDASQCHIIRDYISQSSINKENRIETNLVIHTAKVLPFQQYCDTYNDTETGIDEADKHCLNKWTCAKNEYRCRTGQCIPVNWLCDGKRNSIVYCNILLNAFR